MMQAIKGAGRRQYGRLLLIFSCLLVQMTSCSLQDSSSQQPSLASMAHLSLPKASHSTPASNTLTQARLLPLQASHTNTTSPVRVAAATTTTSANPMLNIQTPAKPMQAQFPATLKLPDPYIGSFINLDDAVESSTQHDAVATSQNLSPKRHPWTNAQLAAKLAPNNTSHSLMTSNQHPLLIYSTRNEIRSYDLCYLPSVCPSAAILSNTALQASPPSSQLSLYDIPTQLGTTSSSSKLSKTLIAGLKNTIGLDFYFSNDDSYIFWTDVIEERIHRGTLLNGTITNVEVVIQNGLATAEGLAIDWVGQNIYWVESALDHIEVAKMNGSFRKTLIAGDMESPRAIAVDPRYGLLFWTDWDKKNPRIERATMSGEDRKTLVYIREVNGGWPNGLTLDFDFLKIYWIDANSDSIHVVDYEGYDHQPVLKHIKSLGHPFSITLFDNNLYWTDWKTNSVSMASKLDGSDPKELQKLPSRLFDIKVFHPSRQPKVENHLNPCHLNNGNCSHLCLLSLNHTRKCDCPQLMKLSPDNSTCESNENVLLIGKVNEIRAVDINEPLFLIMAPISVPKVFNPKQFEYDSKTKSIYWADSQTNEVKRAQLIGNNIDTIIDVIIESPSGLALDWISGNIYVTSAAQQKSLGKIFVSNLDGEYISILMDSSQGIVSPKSLAIHPLLGLMFCVDEKENYEPIIFSATMDGKNKKTLTSKLNNPQLENPSSLSIDYEMNRVYWINQANTGTESASIQYYDIADDKIVTILDESELSPVEKINPSVLCVDGDFLIVGCRSPTESIVRMHKNNLTQRFVLRTPNLDQLSSLKVYNVTIQSGTNACSLNNGNCSQLCLPSNSTHRMCKCTMGYTINPNNETECIGKDLFLIYSYNLGMKGISIEPFSSLDDYFLPPIHRAFRASSIDYIHRENLIYWVDNDEGSITRINRDTTHYQTIVQGLESEESIGLDWVAGNIYWIDPYYDIIEVARLNGSNRYVIVSGDMDKANGIVVNPIKGYIVWSDVGSFPKIETAKLDGSNRKIVVSTGLSHIDDLAIDFADDYIYWVDATLMIVERIKEDGTDRQIVYRKNNSHLVSIAIYKQYLFIADSIQQGFIIRCDKNNIPQCETIQQQLGEGIRDITIYAEQPIPSPLDNPCVKDNGGCQDLCLFMGVRGQKRCICSHGKLNQDGLTCKPYDTFLVFSKLSQINSLHIKDDESFDNSPYPPIVIENRNNIISLTVDYEAQRIIYSEITRDQICSVLFNGTDRKVLIEKQSLVEGIAFVDDQLYWTSIQDNSISRLNITSQGIQRRNCDTPACKIATPEKLIKLSKDDKPRGIAVDRCTSYIYWTNWRDDASIQRASPITGYKVESIIKTDIKVPNGIAIDQEGRKLYWCDAKLDKIESSDMDGSNRIVLISASPPHPFALAIWDNYVFWTDWIARAVFKADKYTGKNPVQIKRVVQRPMGIAVAAPSITECPKDLCAINNGGCPVGSSCLVQGNHTTCWKSGSKPREVAIPTVHCKSQKHKACEIMSYHDIIMDGMERYHPIDSETLESKLHLLEPSSANISSPVMNTNLPSSTVTPNPLVSSTSPNAIMAQQNSTSSPEKHPSTSPDPIAVPVPHNSRDTHISENITKDFYNHEITSSTKFSTPVSSSSTSLPPVMSTSEQSQSKDLSQESTTRILLTNITTTTALPPPQVSQTNSTIPPCQVIPAALQTTTDATFSGDCKLANQFKCYLSEKLVCIPSERRCDGNYDCPSKEDENDCYLSKRDSYNLKRETSWQRFVTVILIILAAAVAALFLVFGNRNRRRWFVGPYGAFNHRRMFDDSGTNIEISNPMFDEDDSGNLVHCAFSIDLNERTTNFSNPLYERQVLLMNDKNVTSN